MVIMKKLDFSNREHAKMISEKVLHTFDSTLITKKILGKLDEINKRS